MAEPVTNQQGSSLPAEEVRKGEEWKEHPHQHRKESIESEDCNGQAVGTIKEVSGHWPLPSAASGGSATRTESN